MTEYKTFKVNALPAVPVINSFYYVNVDSTNVFQLYAIGTTPTDVKQLTTNVGYVDMMAAVTTALTSVNANVIINTVSGNITLTLPPVASNVQINFYYGGGTDIAVIERHPDDADDIFIGANHMALDREWDTMQVKAVGNKWWIL